MAVSEGKVGLRVLVRQTSLRCGDVGAQVPREADDLLQDDPGEGVEG